ncbi:hypothetical protein SAY87_029394 [Trapa incisa]|uniref:CAND6/7 N-terminal domain-containing protein n=1 Tax=Trapa incisa TaxID=236973 RepID=A0AAN7QD29_9MYRT|nr:hypothetical protein SAY87_029394 [Trapa incisa]
MAIARTCTLSFPVILSLASLAAAEIRFTEVRSDGRPIIPFDEFGFTHSGRLELNVSHISFSFAVPDSKLGKLGFFLCTRDSWFQVLKQLEDAEISCTLQSDLIKKVFTFDKFQGDRSTVTVVFPQIDSDQYTLVFANCLQNPQQPLELTMDVRSVMYNLDGKSGRRDYLSAGRTASRGFISYSF